jgi:UDP-N-acetylglucosamine 2-epimerase (non-hydrolysing)
MNITIVAGARPNFVKIAPIIKSIEKANLNGIDINYRLVHTGQHYDKIMSESFFNQLEIPEPNVNLECGGGSQAEQTAAIMTKFEKELLNNRPNIVLVVGDVNSTMACTITAKKLCIDVVHVEAGIRSGDISMPEEINRIVTDSITDHYFTTSEYANENLIYQRINSERIHFVGNTMIDSLYENLSKIKRPQFLDTNEIKNKKYFLLTLHRPSNVDDIDKLDKIISSILDFSRDFPIIFPVHPRTKKNLDLLNITSDKLNVIEPQGYLEFLYLIKNSKGIITDSGGITEEATVLNVPCLTLRNTTERPETVIIGTNELIGDNYLLLGKSIEKIIDDNWKKGVIPKHWDGKTSERIVSKLCSLYNCII